MCRFSNHWGGALLGLAKGALYATLLLWTIQTGALWKQAPGEHTPSWISDSIAISVVDPWNPIRMFTLREMVDEMKARAGTAQTPQDRADTTQTPREEALRKSTSLKDLVNAAKSDPDWATASYRKLLDDPRVQAIIADPELGDMLFGN